MFTVLLARFSQPSPPAWEGMEAGTLTSVTLTFQKPTGFQHGRIIPDESMAFLVTTAPDGIFNNLYTMEDMDENDDGTVSIVAESPILNVDTTQITASVNVIIMEGDVQAHNSTEATASPVTIGASEFGMTNLETIENVTVTVQNWRNSGFNGDFQIQVTGSRSDSQDLEATFIDTMTGSELLRESFGNGTYTVTILGNTSDNIRVDIALTSREFSNHEHTRYQTNNLTTIESNIGPSNTSGYVIVQPNLTGIPKISFGIFAG